MSHGMVSVCLQVCSRHTVIVMNNNLSTSLLRYHICTVSTGERHNEVFVSLSKHYRGIVCAREVRADFTVRMVWIELLL